MISATFLKMYECTGRTYKNVNEEWFSLAGRKSMIYFFLKGQRGEMPQR
jgi:hypothetical protein